jgi:hypothetical protein
VQASEKGEILISGAGHNIRQMFRMSALEQPVRFIEDTDLLNRLGTGGEGQ